LEKRSVSSLSLFFFYYYLSFSSILSYTRPGYQIKAVSPAARSEEVQRLFQTTVPEAAFLVNNGGSHIYGRDVPEGAWFFLYDITTPHPYSNNRATPCSWAIFFPVVGPGALGKEHHKE
jgi:hypothetical protein